MKKLERNIKLARASGLLEGMNGALLHILQYYDIPQTQEIEKKIAQVINEAKDLINEAAHSQEEINEEANGK